MTVGLNSSPLIALARIGQFESLRLLYQELLIPPAVRDEVVRFGEERFGAVELERADWIQPDCSGVSRGSLDDKVLIP